MPSLSVTCVGSTETALQTQSTSIGMRRITVVFVGNRLGRFRFKNNELYFLDACLIPASRKEIRKDPPRVSGRGELCLARQLDKSTSWVKNERARQPRVKRVLVCWAFLHEWKCSLYLLLHTTDTNALLHTHSRRLRLRHSPRSLLSCPHSPSQRRSSSSLSCPFRSLLFRSSRASL